jgi:hypothetical protein
MMKYLLNFVAVTRLLLKLLLIGNSGVGKSCLLLQIADGFLSMCHYSPTISLHFLVGIIRDAHYFWMLLSAKLFNGGNNVPFEQLNLFVFTFFLCVPGAFFMVGVLCSMILT